MRENEKIIHFRIASASRQRVPEKMATNKESFLLPKSCSEREKSLQNYAKCFQTYMITCNCLQQRRTPEDGPFYKYVNALPIYWLQVMIRQRIRAKIKPPCSQTAFQALRASARPRHVVRGLCWTVIRRMFIIIRAQLSIDWTSKAATYHAIQILHCAQASSERLSGIRLGLNDHLMST